jgi:hypothetical protein
MVRQDGLDRLANSSVDTATEKACWTPNRKELLEWLRRNATSLAELYEGAILLLTLAHPPGYTRFVAHAVREIKNRLPDAIFGTTSGGRLDYTNRLENVAKDWKEAGFPIDGTAPVAETSRSSVESLVFEVPLPRNLFLKVAKLLADHEEHRRKPIDAAIRLFEGNMDENQNFRNALRPVVEQWLAVNKWFMAKVHDSGATDVAVGFDDLQKNFELFESSLLVIVRGPSAFFATTAEIDEILEDANS